MTHSQTPEVEPQLIRVGEAARLLSVSRSKLYALMESGELSYCKIGGSRRVPRQAVIDLIERSLVSR